MPFRPSVCLVTKKRKGRPWPRAAAAATRQCSLYARRARAGHPRPSRPPFCSYVVHTYHARFGCRMPSSFSIEKCV